MKGTHCWKHDLWYPPLSLDCPRCLEERAALQREELLEIARTRERREKAREKRRSSAEESYSPSEPWSSLFLNVWITWLLPFLSGATCAWLFELPAQQQRTDVRWLLVPGVNFFVWLYWLLASQPPAGKAVFGTAVFWLTVGIVLFYWFDRKR